MLDPVQALAYARSRHFQYKKNGKWVDDPTGDLGRISRQQDFIKRALKRAIDKGARNPATALSLITAAASAITIDETLTVGDMRDLVTRFRDFNVDTLQSDQVPTRAAPIGGVAYQAVDWDAAWPLLEPFWGAAAGSELGPRDLVVTVARSTGSLTSEEVVSKLEAQRFDADESDSARGRARGTNIAFGPNGRDAAATLARWLDASDLTYTFDPTLPGRRVVLTPGDGLSNVRSEPMSADAVPEPPAASLPPTSRPGTTAAPTTEQGGSEAGAPAATTTTVPGIVPTDPDAALRCSASG